MSSTGFSIRICQLFCLMVLFCLPVQLTEAQDKESPPAQDDKVGQDQTADGEAAAEGADADETLAEVLAGHSYHGEAFNEGPRQSAYQMGGTGSVEFPATCKNDQVQVFVNQGVGQLHGFWYLEAERSFRQAIAMDPDCAIAYWGCAVANINDKDRAKGFIEDAKEHLEKVTEREKRYINSLATYLNDEGDNKEKRALAYMKELEDIVIDYPDDIEAKAFVALQTWLNRSQGVPIGSYLAVDSLLKEVFAAQPMHPAHHYAIHLWDTRRPELALESAAKCGPAAPSIAHMWHMPGHIYSRLKRYEDAVWQQEASARTDHAHMMRDRVMPDQIHNFAHNNEWLIRNLIFIGRVQDGLDLAMNMSDLPRHPSYNTLEKRGSAKYGRERMVDVLTTYQLWDKTIELCHLPYLEPTDDEREQLLRLRVLGAAYWMSGQAEQGQQVLDELNERLVPMKTEREELVAKTESEFSADEKEQEGKSEEERKKSLEKKVKAATKEIDGKISRVEKAIQAVEGYQAFAAEDYKTAHERFVDSKTESQDWVAEVRFLMGEQDEAIKDAQRYVDRHENEVAPLSRLVYLQATAGKMEEAKKSFETLREISGSIDRNSVLFTRLDPIASELGFEGDWRVPSKLADDIPPRTLTLDEIGPFRWRPSRAPEWALKQADGSLRSSKEFQGKPVLMIFYLGYGCLHCAEQLHEFAPQMEAFEQAGIEMIAISSDDVEGLQRSIDDYDKGLPIPLISNAELDVFKSYRAFDDFEDMPLHGTFLVDGNGYIRWQDISYEPYMDHQFLLKEAQRLLSQELELPVSTTADSASTSESDDVTQAATFEQ